MGSYFPKFFEWPGDRQGQENNLKKLHVLIVIDGFHS